MPQSDPTAAAVPVHGGHRVTARVQWFDPAKGFGFVLPEGGGGPVFLHVSVLNRAGLYVVAEGNVIDCNVVIGPRGLQVADLFAVLETETPTQLSAEPAPGPVRDAVGTVKWFKADKGYGFVLADDGGIDVFVHSSVLRRSNMADLETGQRVSLQVRPTLKGREAVWVGPE